MWKLMKPIYFHYVFENEDAADQEFNFFLYS